MNCSGSHCQEFPHKMFNYLNEVPKNSKYAIAGAFGISFLSGTLLSGGNVAFGIVRGSLSALATSIYALITPLFKKMCPHATRLSPTEELVRYAIPLSCAYVPAMFIFKRFPVVARFSLSLLICFTTSQLIEKRLDRTHLVCV